MLHLTWKCLRDENLQTALDKIRHSTKLDQVSAYRAGKVTQNIASQQDKAHDKNMELVKKWAKKDEKGELIHTMVPGSGVKFEFEDGQKEKYEEEMGKIAETQFVVKSNKIDFTTLRECQLTPAEIIALEENGLITEPEASS